MKYSCSSGTECKSGTDAGSSKSISLHCLGSLSSADGAKHAGRYPLASLLWPGHAADHCYLGCFAPSKTFRLAAPARLAACLASCRGILADRQKRGASFCVVSRPPAAQYSNEAVLCPWQTFLSTSKYQRHRTRRTVSRARSIKSDSCTEWLEEKSTQPGSCVGRLTAVNEVNPQVVTLPDRSDRHVQLLHSGRNDFQRTITSTPKNCGPHKEKQVPSYALHCQL